MIILNNQLRLRDPNLGNGSTSVYSPGSVRTRVHQADKREGHQPEGIADQARATYVAQCLVDLGVLSVPANFETPTVFERLAHPSRQRHIPLTCSTKPGRPCSAERRQFAHHPVQSAAGMATSAYWLDTATGMATTSELATTPSGLATVDPGRNLSRTQSRDEGRTERSPPQRGRRTIP